jgi:glycosyl transferase, family 25
MTVAEDDAVFNRHFSGKAAGVLHELPADWDIVLWGWNFDAILHVELIDGLKRSVMRFDHARLEHRIGEFQNTDYRVLPLRLLAAFGIVCYSVSPRGARRLLDRCFPLANELISIPGCRRRLPNTSVAHVMNKHYGDLKSYVSFPPLVWTENDKQSSDVNPKWPLLHHVWRYLAARF